MYNHMFNLGTTTKRIEKNQRVRLDRALLESIGAGEGDIIEIQVRLAKPKTTGTSPSMGEAGVVR